MLEVHNAAVRTALRREPLRGRPVPEVREELVVLRTAEGFRRELASRCVVAGGTRLPVAVVTGPGTVPVAFADGVQHVLPEAAADWVDELDLRSIIHLRDAEPVVQALLLDLPQRNRTMANG